jgi:hypothetical protein
MFVDREQCPLFIRSPDRIHCGDRR